MTAGVGVFGAEGWAEGIDFGQRTGVSFAVELARDRQEGFFTKEVFIVVHFAFWRARQVFEIQRRDAEHFTCTFCIRRSDQRSRNPEVTLLIEETMQRLRQRMTHARHRTNQVGTRTQVRDFTQVLNAVTFCRHRVGVRIFNPAGNLNGCGLNFKTLALTR